MAGNNRTQLSKSIAYLWAKVWLRFAGTNRLGRFATQVASIFSPPYKARRKLARFGKRGYIAPTATIHCRKLTLGKHVFIGERVTIYCANEDGEISIGDGVSIHQDGIIEVGQGGQLTIGDGTQIQPRLQLSAYKGSVSIGSNVQIAPNCAFYPYDHSVLPDKPISQQPLITKGGIIIEEDVWLGFGVIVLDGVRVGRGAVIGAGAVVTGNIPEGAIAAGVPARVIKMRKDVKTTLDE